MSSNDPPSEKKEPESQASASAPTATRPPPPSERRGQSMPPPPPRRSAKPSGPPPPPPRPPRGQRLAGVFSTPPPAPTPAAPAAPATVATALVAAAVPAPPPAETPPTQTPPVETPPVETPPVETPLTATPPVETPLAEPPLAAIAPVDAPVALPTSISLPPPAVPAGSNALLSRLATAQARVISAVPPGWIEVARKHPVLWMAVAPVTLASLFVLLLLAFEPPRAPAQARPAASAAAAPASAEAAPASPTPAMPEQPAKQTLAELESKPVATLSVAELLLLNEGRAERKREEVQALARKLHDQSEANDESLQAQLLRQAADPDTAEAALAAMAQARSPAGPDLLYQVWTSPGVAAGTAELARSLLYSREVRPNASAALAAALQLRAADSCEAVQAALAEARSDGDRRSLSSLAKLNSRRGCGAKKNQDCYPCLRADMKQVVSAINAAKRRPAPAFSTR